MDTKDIAGAAVPQTTITLRLSVSDKNRLKEISSLAGLTLSEYLRRRFFGGRPIVAFTDTITVRELRRIGGLLKHNFETLRLAKADPKLLELQEQILRELAERIDYIGAQSDRKESKE